MSTFTFRFLAALVLLAGIHSRAAAQSTGEGSIYSRFGIGELRSFNSSQSQGMGGGGTALFSFNYLNRSNPASWGDQVLTRISAGVLFQGVHATDATDDISRLTEGSINAFHFSFPIVRQRLGFAAAYEPYSRINYVVRSEGELQPDPVFGDTSQYVVDLNGNGGLQTIVAGLGYRISPNLSVGASVNFLFGIMETARNTRFPGSIDHITTRVATSTRFSGFTGTAGALLSIPRPLSEQDILLVGASFTLPAHLNAARSLTLGRGLDRDTLTNSTSGSAEFPLSAQLGAAYLYEDRWIFVANALYEPWSTFESDLPFAGYDPSNGVSNFSDRIRASLGAEFLPAGADVQEPFLRRVAYRLGFYYDQSYVSPPEASEPINTIALTGGFGLPTVVAGTRIDLGWEIGTRGTTTGLLVQDRFYRVSASLNFGERWFQQRQLN
jgi:hypothetical protein